ncbi:MAG: translation initiation factor IF-2 [Bacteroidales bacterium]|jgi:translation initiation factor IF-2
MSEKQGIRISKVVKEFNIGIGTLTDFLKKKGIEVDASPNSKISEEAYALVEKEFNKELQLKEESKKIILKVKEATSEEPPVQEPVRDPEPKPAPMPAPKPQPEPAPEPQPEPAPEPQPEPAHVPAPSPEIRHEEIVKPAPKQTETTTEKGPTVLGKIDLDQFRKTKDIPAPKTEKETEVQKPEPVPQKPAPEKESRSKPKPGKKPEPAPQPKPVAPEHIETEFEKLAGPKITGQIDLSQFNRKKPSEDKDKSKTTDKHKGKRERIQKPHRERVDVNKVTPKKSDNGGRGKGRGKERFKPIHVEIDEDAIQKQIKETYARMTEGKGKTKGSKHRREKRDIVSQRMAEEQERIEQESTVLKVTEFVTVNELATLMNVPVVKVIDACMNLGLMVSINQRLDAEAMELVAEEFGFKVEFVTADLQETIQEEADDPADLSERPPIVTVMGHVDHGKTSLLDHIRDANVIAGEAGGITQHIGAYSVVLDNGRLITFLDTPGHEAFTAMRARGAKVTDMAIIIIAADDAIMPQTKEAINHASAAGVPMIFAINKIDKTGANPEKIREQLANMNFLVEDWGGKYQCQEISAKQGTNIDKLLEKVLLEADLLELRANPNKRASGTIIESSLDKGRGYLATILVQNGTLHQGDVLLSGCCSGKVRAMYNERGQKITQAGPATPASVLGLNGAPPAGELFAVMEDEKEARELAGKREQLMRIQGLKTQKHITLEEIGRRIAVGNFQELNIIVKADVDGSIEALSDSLIKLSTEEVQVNVIHKAVGGISESDVLLATASNAIIIGFQVRPSSSARKLAEKEEIEIRLYSVIYDAIDEVKQGIEGMLAPEEKEEITATVEVRETFKISKVGTIAGCMVKEGKITRNAKVRIIRDGIVIYTGTLGSLKRFKDDVKEVQSGYDCGLNIDGYNDIKVGDIVEAYTITEVKRKL